MSMDFWWPLNASIVKYVTSELLVTISNVKLQWFPGWRIEIDVLQKMMVVKFV